MDLEYPNDLHEHHDTYPCAPEHKKIQPKDLSSYQRDLVEKLKIKPGQEKLCLTLENKMKYKLHIRFDEYLEFYLLYAFL